MDAVLGKEKRFIFATKGKRGPTPGQTTIGVPIRRKENSPDTRGGRAIAHALNVPFFNNFLGDFAKSATGPIPSTRRISSGPDTWQEPYDKGGEGPRTSRRSRFQTRERAVPASVRLLPAHMISFICFVFFFFRARNLPLVELHPAIACPRLGIQSKRAQRPRRLLKKVLTNTRFDLATGWHQYRNDPAVSDHGWYARTAQKARPGPTSGDGKTRCRQGRSPSPPTESRSCQARRSIQFEEVNTELPVWMPIEQIFVTVISARRGNLPKRRAGDRQLARSWAFRVT